MQMYMKISNVFFKIKVCDLFESIRKQKLLKKMIHIISLSSKILIFFSEILQQSKKKPITIVYQH